MVLARLAALYALVVLMMGFVLGAIRVTVVAPYLGEAGAVLLEIPIMLALSWWVWTRLRPSTIRRVDKAAVIGAGAFLLLQVGESLLSGFFGSASFDANLTAYWKDLTPGRLIGIAGQLLFAMIPSLQVYKDVQR